MNERIIRAICAEKAKTSHCVLFGDFFKFFAEKLLTTASSTKAMKLLAMLVSQIKGTSIAAALCCILAYGDTLGVGSGQPGLQMVDFHTKNPPSEWEISINFMTTWNILNTFCTYS
jgi:hypothetical protein